MTTTFYIPFDTTGDQHQDLEPEHLEFDLHRGSKARLKAYRVAWAKCFNRVQTLIQALYRPAVVDIIDHINSAYSSPDVILALPHPELPTIAVTNPSSDTFLLSSVVSELSDHAHAHLVCHLYPSDCSNLTIAMKSIISGFISSSESIKTSARSLASYDIGVLEAWYTAQENIGKLILLLHDFEQIDPSVLQDVIHILRQSSLHTPQIPLVLLVSLSSPQSPSSYFQITYPRSSLKLLRIHSVIAPGGIRIFEEVVMKTFVDMGHDPDIFLGPAALEYLAEYAARLDPSADVILNVLQLAHLKHFLSNPLTALTHSTPSIDTLQNPASSEFKTFLVDRLNYDEFLEQDDEAENIPLPSYSEENLPDVIKAVDGARAEFQIRTQGIRLAYFLLQLVHNFLLEKGYKGLGVHWGKRSSSTASAAEAAPILAFRARDPSQSSSSSTSAVFSVFAHLQNFINIMQKDSNSQTSKDIRFMRTLLRKLKPDELADFLGILIEYLEGLADDVIGALNLNAVVRKLEKWRGEADDDADIIMEEEDHSTTMRKVAENLAEWMFEYIDELTEPLESAPLWDVWYTGMTPYPAEVCVIVRFVDLIAEVGCSQLQALNPSIYTTILAGLLRPRQFAADDESRDKEDEDEDDPLWRLPDTSILLHRYLESGRMINVYDWFESFHVVLETQRKEHLEPRRKERSKGRTKSKKASNSKSDRGKGRGKASKAQDTDGTYEVVEENAQETEHENIKHDNIVEDGDAWKLVIQARFIRALHELDLMGFLKHTRRRPDHVLRTVFELPEQ
ncbi:hypothetical protein D9757_008017 [Collybiopsis confluens]|uniref:Origin recognition complex subunit 3 n=1 Tax=Collybiopsis confluens TaxID=2823264 RepID=A0A8H5H616_9AGAR|nr:hypothetical protein D9757_008017 [Collybiopsis confluens]